MSTNGVSASPPPDDLATAGAALIELAEQRTRARIGWIRQAVEDFCDDSDVQLAGQDAGHGAISFWPVVDGLVGAIGTALFPEAEPARAAFDAARQALGDHLPQAVDAHGPGAAGLRAAVDALRDEMRQREAHAIDQATPLIASPVQHAVAELEYGSTDPGWLDQMCAWMGFSEASREAAYDPIRQWLEYEFAALLAAIGAGGLPPGG